MDNENQILIDEITNTLGTLELEDLLFIKQQLAVLQYNQQIRARNAAIQENGQKETENKKEESVSEDSHAEKAQGVYFDQLSNGKFFNLCIGNAKLFIDYKEIKSLLKIAQSADSSLDGSIRIYNWLKRERSDILGEGGIGNRTHPALTLIYQELIENFSTDDG